MTYSDKFAREQSIHCMATSAMFDRRARSLKSWLSFLDYWGLGLPLAVGGLALAGIKLSSVAFAAAGLLALAQSLMFLWAITKRMPDLLESAAEGRRVNREHAEQYDAFAKTPPSPEEWIRLEAQRASQSAQDEKAGLTDEEKRYGMRVALRQYKWKCATCRQVPTAMAPSGCETCGKFNKKWVK